MNYLYFVSYDLRKPEKDYPRLWAALKALNAKRLLFSEWSLRSTSSLQQVYDYFVKFIDSNDGLMVTFVNEARGSGTQTPLSQV